MDAGAEGVQSTNEFSMTLGETRLLIFVAPAQAGAHPVYRPSAALSNQVQKNPAGAVAIIWFQV
jgi:hypothetical protein